MIAPPAPPRWRPRIAVCDQPTRRLYHLGGETPLPVSAMAICRYDGSDDVYPFKCATDWEVIMDTDCCSADEAMQTAARQAESETPAWITVSSH